MSYSPSVDDYRITKEVNEEGKYLVWRFEIDGVWEFTAAMTDKQASDFFMYLHLLDPEDAEYSYYRAS